MFQLSISVATPHGAEATVLVSDLVPHSIFPFLCSLLKLRCYRPHLETNRELGCRACGKHGCKQRPLRYLQLDLTAGGNELNV